MTFTVDLPEPLLDALRSEATRREMTVESVVGESVQEHLATSTRRRLAISGIGASDGTRRARDADVMLDEGFGHV